MSARPSRPQASHKTRHPREDLSWMELANCRGTDSRMFHDPNRYSEALQVCCHCVVVQACRRYGRNQPGVWGGRIHDTRKNTDHD